MNNEWRILCSSVCLLTDTHAYFSAIEKKSYKILIEKTISKSFTELDLSEEKFKVRLNKNLEIEVTSDSLGGKWYIVGNYDKSGIGTLITEASNTKGVFDSEEFELEFCDKTPDIIRLVSPEMKEYKSGLEEMTRRLNCEIYKKTTKWVPGHRYDSPFSTAYYLCPVKSRKTNEAKPYYAEYESNMGDAIFYVNSLHDDEKTISDVLNNRIIGEGPDDIKVMPKPVSMVDSGAFLTDDFSGDLRDYQDKMIERAVENTKINSKHGLIMHDDCVKVYNTICYYTEGKCDYKISDSNRALITEMLEMSAFEALATYWGGDMNQSKSDEDNISYLMHLLFIYTSEMADSEGYINFYKELVKAAGFDVNTIATKEYNIWRSNLNSINTNHDFGIYYKFLELFNRNAAARRCSSIGVITDKSSLKHYLSDRGYKHTEAVITEMINYAIDNEGCNVSSYVKENCGLKRKPDYYHSFTITVDDIVNYEKGIENLTENLKNELIDSKIRSIDFYIRAGEKF